MNTAKLIVGGMLAAAAGAYAQVPKPIKVITTASLNATGITTFDRDTAYHLSGRVFVGQNAGQPQDLVIESGTVIKGLPGELVNAACLVITKHGTISANGTATQPIVFTSVLDNEYDPTDLGAFDRGLWGGVILLGEAPISEGSTWIEGLDSTDARGQYGGSNPTDNSGTMTYVSIRHGGKLIGGANEINGLTMGGVGSGTTLHHIEVFANNDDGFEWFGGTVNAKHLISAYGNDDAFDFDFGYKGKLQYAFAIYHNGNVDASGNQAIEGDGFAIPLFAGTDTSMYSNPQWSNLTLVGNGNPQNVSVANDLAFRLRDGTAGDFKNMIIQDWRVNAGRFDAQASICDANCQIARDSLNLDGSIFWNIGNWLGAFSNIIVSTGFADDTIAVSSTYQNPGLISVGQTVGSVDPRPSSTSVAAYTVPHFQMADPSFFDPVTYAGAFAHGDDWMSGWSMMSQSKISNSHLTFQPGSGSQYQPYRLYRQSGFDLIIHQVFPGDIDRFASTAELIMPNGSVTNLDVTFRNVVYNNHVMVGLDRLYDLNGQRGNVFGLAGKYGLHVRIKLLSGIVLEDTFWFQTVQ